jgi:hypothetical protein
MRPRPGSPAALLLTALLAVGTLAACADDAEPAGTGDEPGASTSSPSPDTDLCDVVGDARLSGWTGTPVTVEGEAATADGTVECRAVVEPDDGHEVTWAFEEPEDSWQENLDSVMLAQMEREDVTLPGGADATVLTTTDPTNLTTVVTRAGDRLLVVTASDLGIGEPLTVAHLTEVATRVAGAYTG